MSDPALTEFLHAVMPFTATLGIRGVANGPNEVVMEMDWTAEACTAGGVLHGGALMALADSCGAALAFANLPDGATGTTTIEGKTNMIGAVTEGTVTARSTLVHAGGQTIVVDTEVRHGDRLISKTVQTQLVLR
ncbi:MAG: PaaI family thioesterase [Actinomycetota bacterium]